MDGKLHGKENILNDRPPGHQIWLLKGHAEIGMAFGGLFADIDIANFAHYAANNPADDPQKRGFCRSRSAPIN